MGRNQKLEFLLTLRDSEVRFLVVDMPGANDLTFGIMTLVAQTEREAISRRTKQALAVARVRGVTLGSPNGAAAPRLAGKGGVALREAVMRNADAHAEGLARVVAHIRAARSTSLRAVVDALIIRGMLTRATAVEWRTLGIRVNCINPSPIESRMIAPTEVAGLVAFLASDDAGYVNGGAYTVYGGFTAD